MITLKTTALAALALSLAVSAAPAFARGIDYAENHQATVSYADLDVYHRAGATVLLQRIKATAQRMCGPTPDFLDIAGWRSFNNCVQQSVARAVSQLGIPLVTELYEGAGPTTIATRN